MSIGKSSIARAAGSVSTAKPAKSSPTSKSAKTIPANPDAVFLEIFPDGLIPCAAAPATEASKELVQSIRKYGILLPVLVCRTEAGELYLADGCKRIAVAKQLGLSTVPARVIPVADAKSALRIYQTLGATSSAPQKMNLHDAKFQAVVSITDDMPDYLL